MRIRPIFALPALVLVLAPSSAEAVPFTFTNSTVLGVPDGGSASSSITTPAGVWTLTLFDDSLGSVGSLSGGWSIELDVVGGSVADVNVSLFGLSHTFMADVDIRLQGPIGSFRDLTSDNGGSSDATNATITFDDEAALSLQSLATFAPGTYRPELGSPLSIYDGLAFVTGPVAVPEPATIALLGAGLAAAAVRRRRRR